MSDEDGFEGSLPYEDETPEEFRERMQESSLSRVELVGELYYGDELAVRETKFGDVALFNLIYFKKTRNGFKEHRLYIKTFSADVIEWLREQPKGLFIRISGVLESNGNKCYVNAKKIEPMDDEVERDRYAQIRKEMQQNQETPADEEDLAEASAKIRRIRFADRTLAMARGGICADPEEGVLQVEIELGAEGKVEDARLVQSMVNGLDESYKRRSLPDDRKAPFDDEELAAAWKEKRRELEREPRRFDANCDVDSLAGDLDMSEKLKPEETSERRAEPEHQGWKQQAAVPIPAPTPASAPEQTQAKKPMFSNKKKSSWGM